MSHLSLTNIFRRRSDLHEDAAGIMEELEQIGRSSHSFASDDQQPRMEAIELPRTAPPIPWSNPSLLQMAENLQVQMMTMSSPLETLPVEYNSHVLALIEGFGKLQAGLDEANRRLATLSSDQERSQEELRCFTAEWMQQDATYKAEIRRLELIIAKTSEEGMATLALARGDTLVDRNRARKLVDRLQRMSNSHEVEEEAVDGEIRGDNKKDSGVATRGTVKRTDGDGVVGASSSSSSSSCPPYIHKRHHHRPASPATDKDILASDSIRKRDSVQERRGPQKQRKKIISSFLGLRQAADEADAKASRRTKIVRHEAPAVAPGTDLLSRTKTMPPSDSSSTAASSSSSDDIRMRRRFQAQAQAQVQAQAQEQEQVTLSRDYEDGANVTSVATTAAPDLNRLRRRFSFVAGDDRLILPGRIPNAMLRRPSLSSTLDRSSGTDSSGRKSPSAAPPYSIIARVAAARAIAGQK